MADVRPLPGIRYAESANLAELVTPPYDVISPDAQTRYYERHPENIIRLELGRDEPGDNDLDNRYSRAAMTFAEWRLHGIMIEDTPSLYLYRQHFMVGQTMCRRTSLLARVRLEPWSAGVVLPHEHTLKKAKDDRLKLLRACAANLSPIMALYDDPTAELQALLAGFAESSPAVDFQDEVGEEHQMWRIAESDVFGRIADFFRNRQLYIADGHHRYETSLEYRDEQIRLRKGASDADAVNFTLMALSAVEDPGLVVLPTHRILYDLDSARMATIGEALEPYFSIEYLPGTLEPEELLARLDDSAATHGTTAAVLVRPYDALLLTLGPGGRKAMEQLDEEPGQASPAWRQLDLAVLHELVLGRGLGISPEMVHAGEHVGYTRDASLAVVESRKSSDGASANQLTLGLLVRPTPPAAIRDVAKAGDRMPQKSTYFYPKLITGLVVNPTW
jgi:uncharacterized protein (DUF1015 family)